MKPKKNSADWYIAATHWLTSMVASVIMSFVAIFVIAMASANPIVDLFSQVLVLPLVMWPAVKMSASYLNKTYVIRNPHRIIILSFAYLTIIAGGYRVYNFAKTGIFSIEYLGFIIALAVFYFASQKLIRANA